MKLGPKLRFRRLWEWPSLAIGTEHVIDVEVVPRFGQIQHQELTINLVGVQQVAIHQWMECVVKYYFFPVYDSAAQETYDTIDALKNLYDMRVVKTADEWALDMSAAQAAGELEDYIVGGDDDSLVMQRGKVHLNMITQVPSKGMLLYERKVRLGYMFKSADRTADNRYRYMYQLQSILNSGFTAPEPGYILGILTIPEQVDDGYNDTDIMFPKSRDFEEIGALVSPKWDMFSDQKNLTVDYPVASDRAIDHRDLVYAMEKLYIATAPDTIDDDEDEDDGLIARNARQYVQSTLRATVMRDIIYDRTMHVPQQLSPSQDGD